MGSVLSFFGLLSDCVSIFTSDLILTMTQPNRNFIANCQKESAFTDKYPCGQRNALLSGIGENSADINSRYSIYSRMAPKDLLVARFASTESMQTINTFISKEVKTLSLFSDRRSYREYEAFLVKSGISNDRGFNLSTKNTSAPNMAIFQRDIPKLLNNDTFLNHFKSVNRLVYYGYPSIEPDGKMSPYWHKFMHLVVGRLPSLKSLVVHRLGYEGLFEPLNNQIYKNLRDIHIVQPGYFVIEQLKAANFEVKEGYSYKDPRELCYSEYLDTNVVKLHPTIYYHCLRDWHPGLKDSPSIDVIIEDD